MSIKDQLIAGGWISHEYRHATELMPTYWKWGLFELKEISCAPDHEAWLDGLAEIDDDTGFRFNDDYPTGGESVYVWEKPNHYPVPTTCVICETDYVQHPLEVQGDLTLQSQCCLECWEWLRWPEKWHPHYNNVRAWWDRVYRRREWEQGGG